MVLSTDFVINTAASPAAIDSATAANANLAASPQIDVIKVVSKFKSANLQARYGANKISTNFNILLGELEGAEDVLKIVNTIVLTNYTALMLMNTVLLVKEAVTIKEKALAAAETAVAVTAQQWHRIVLAAAAAVGISASFSLGYIAGKERTRTDNHSISGNMNDPVERRAAMQKFKAVTS